MSGFVKTILSRLKASQEPGQDGFDTASRERLFARTDPFIDGAECLHDCESCHITYPRSFKIDEDEELYGHVNGWSTHLVVATGATDWKRDIADEKGSIMEALEAGSVKPTNGRLMISASNMPVPAPGNSSTPIDAKEKPTTVLLLPAFVFIDNVTPSSGPDLIRSYIDRAPTTTTPLEHGLSFQDSFAITDHTASGLKLRHCPHAALILLCSHKTRDARCGQSAPLLKREFERHLRALQMQRDLEDTRPGGVGVYFISHVGGHKFSANVLIYRRAGAFPSTPRENEQESGDAARHSLSENQEHNPHENSKGAQSQNDNVEATQCIWLARIRPEDCENIVRYTVLQGKVVKPERQLRGGFNRERCLTSW